MKKLLFILGLSLLTLSCQKENIEPNQNENETTEQNCGCGVIIQQSHHIDGTLRSVKVENYCSKGLYSYWPTQSDLTSNPYYLGSEWCHPSGNTW